MGPLLELRNLSKDGLPRSSPRAFALVAALTPPLELATILLVARTGRAAFVRLELTPKGPPT
jgi:hypothetical protein